jgi:hypothetical protein
VRNPVGRWSSVQKAAYSDHRTYRDIIARISLNTVAISRGISGFENLNVIMLFPSCF